MKKLTLFLAITLCLIGIKSNVAWGLAIDTLEDIGPNGSTITQRLIDGVLVDITVGSGGSLIAGTYYDPSFFLFGGATEYLNRNNDPLNPSSVSLDRFVNINVGSGNIYFPPLTFDFSSPISEFGLTTIDLLENKTGADDWVTFYAYDSHGNILDEHTRIGRQGLSGLDLDWSLSSAENNITQVVMISMITAYSGHGIDDIYLDAAPVPEDTLAPSGSVHAYPNLIWPPNNLMVTIALEGRVMDEMSIAREGGGHGVSSAYLLIGGTDEITLWDDTTDLLDADSHFSVEIEVKASKSAEYLIELFAADKNPDEPNSGLVDTIYIRVSR